jgi:hypothetical protein
VAAVIDGCVLRVRVLRVVHALCEIAACLRARATALTSGCTWRCCLPAHLSVFLGHQLMQYVSAPTFHAGSACAAMCLHVLQPIDKRAWPPHYEPWAIITDYLSLGFLGLQTTRPGPELPGATDCRLPGATDLQALGWPGPGLLGLDRPELQTTRPGAWTWADTDYRLQTPGPGLQTDYRLGWACGGLQELQVLSYRPGLQAGLSAGCRLPG